MKIATTRHLSRLFLGVITLSLVLFSVTAKAQGLGSISGTVVDSSGAAVPAATVTVVSIATGTSATATVNSSGGYVFPALAPSTYTLSVVAAGFQKAVQQNVILNADQALTNDLTLQLGEVTQTVTVAVNQAQVDTTTGTVSQVIDQRRVNDLPLNARNAAQLTTLVSGVTIAPNDAADQGNTKTFPVAVTISANGSRADQTNYLLNGGNNVDEYTDVNGPFPFPDALQEFSVQTSNYNAEYGQNAGAVVNLITKSGGQEFHGDAFEYVRNRIFNARNYFAAVVDPLKRNQLGGTFSGPLIIPHVLSGKKAQFFFGYQKTISHDVINGLSADVPTAAELRGDFSAFSPANTANKAPQVIYNPFTKQPYASYQIPTSNLSKAALAFAAALGPLSTDPTATFSAVSYSKPQIQGFDEYVARVDSDITSKDHIFGHYYYNKFTNAAVLDPAALLSYADGSNILYQSALLSESHAFTPSLLNNFILNYLREVSTRGPAAGAPGASDFGVSIPQLTPGIQQIGVTGFFNVGDNAHASFYRASYTLADDVHWVKGRHNVAFGFHGELSNVSINSGFNEPGYFIFNTTIVSKNNLTNPSLANFLQGYLGTFGQGNGQYLDEKNQFLGFYTQDSWKVTDRFTMNYGLRYEPFFPWQEKKHRIEQFNPTAYLGGQTSTIYTAAPKGLLFPGDNGVPEQGIHNIYTNVMPRLGFAWNVFGNGMTSIRGGAGMFFDTRQPGIYIGTMSVATPFSVNVGYTNPVGSFDNPYQGVTIPFPIASPAPSNTSFPTPVRVYTYNPSGRYQVPLAYDWNITLEQQLSSSMILHIGYVGAHDSHLETDNELNPATYVPGCGLGTDQRRMFNGVLGGGTGACASSTSATLFGNIIAAGTGADENYHSLQTTMERHFSQGISVLANYTWSKSLDTVPYGTGVTNLNPGQSYVYPIYFPNYKSLDKGPSDFDTRHVFSASYVLGPSNLRRDRRWVRAIANGWQHTGIVRATSGQPLTVVAGTDRSGTGLNQDRAVYIGISAYGSGACATVKAKCKDYLDTTKFSLPVPGHFGNISKGTFRAPKYVDWDASVARTFPINDRLNLQFRADYFNLLNHTNFLAPVNSLSGAGFGGITSANDPRIAQLSGKLSF